MAKSKMAIVWPVLVMCSWFIFLTSLEISNYIDREIDRIDCVMHGFLYLDDVIIKFMKKEGLI